MCKSANPRNRCISRAANLSASPCIRIASSWRAECPGSWRCPDIKRGSGSGSCDMAGSAPGSAAWAFPVLGRWLGLSRSTATPLAPGYHPVPLAWLRAPCAAAREFDEVLQSRMLQILQQSMFVAEELRVLLRKVASFLHRCFHGCAYEMRRVVDEQDCVWEEVVLRVLTHLPKSAVDHQVFH